MSRVSENVSQSMKQKEVLEFNAQFESYADREEGLTLQEFMTIYNLVTDWNERVPTDKVEINVIDRSAIGIKQYLQGNTKDLEGLITKLENPELYYFKFSSDGIEYDKREGRIWRITMTMSKKT